MASDIVGVLRGVSMDVRRIEDETNCDDMLDMSNDDVSIMKEGGNAE